MLFPLAAAALLLTVSSCSKDDPAPGDPAGTVTLNMLNEQNGKTVLANSGVYINQADNFYGGSSCLIADAGPVSGVGALGEPALPGLSTQVAATPGHGYFFCDPGTVVEFPSGAFAMTVGASYYKVYVASWLADGKGAVVKYLSAKVSEDYLPDYDAMIGTLNGMDESLRIELPTDDFEYYESFDAEGMLSFEREWYALVIRLRDGATPNGNYPVYLRAGGSYTRFYVRVSRM